jgi:hypothetical protein
MYVQREKMLANEFSEEQRTKKKREHDTLFSSPGTSGYAGPLASVLKEAVTLFLSHL